MPKYREPLPDNGPVGANILHVRRKLHITQKQLAAPEFSISYISAIERGRIRPSLKALEILARRLGVSSGELLVEHPAEQAPEEAASAGRAQAASLPLVQLISQRRTSYPIPLALTWANVALLQGEPLLAEEVLHLLSATTLTSEQRLLQSVLLARVYLATHRSQEAQSQLEPLVLHESSSDELLLRCRFLLARAYEQQGKFLEASEQFTAVTQALESGQVSDPLLLIECYTEAAKHFRQRERRDLAGEYYRLALAQLDLVVQPLELARLSARMAQGFLQSARTILSDWYAARSMGLLELVEGRQKLAQAAIHLGIVQQEMGDAIGATQQLQRAIELCEQLGALNFSVEARMALAEVLLERKQPQKAEQLMLEAQTISSRALAPSAETDVLRGRLQTTLGSIYLALGRLDASDAAFRDAIALLQAHQASEYLALAYYRYSELLNQRQQFAEGYELARQAYLLEQRKREA